MKRNLNFEERAGRWFSLPYLIFMAIFFVYPFGFAFYLLFNRWDLVTNPQFVGMGNISFLWNDPMFWQALSNTFLFLIIHIPLQIVLALLIANILARPLKGKTFFRASFFLPVVISGAVVTILWQKLYATDGGLINYLLSFIGIDAIPWLTHPKVAMPSIAIMATWKNVGLYIILFLTGILSIPKHLYEAAKMEGCSSWQEFWYVTLPMLKPSMLLVVVMSTMGAFNLFIEPYVMTGGGPMGSTMSLVLYMYKQAFFFQHMGYAATIGFALALLVLVVVLVQRKYLDKEN